MRIILGALTLLIALAIASWMARTQVKAVATPMEVSMPDGTTQALKPEQIEQQYKKSLEDAMNTARPRAPDE